MGQSMGQLNTIGQADMQNYGGDFSTKEKGIRLGMDALGGLGKGYQNYQQQNAALRQGGGPQLNPMQYVPSGAPQFSADNLPGGGAGTGQPGSMKRNRSFFGDFDG